MVGPFPTKGLVDLHQHITMLPRRTPASWRRPTSPSPAPTAYGRCHALRPYMDTNFKQALETGWYNPGPTNKITKQLETPKTQTWNPSCLTSPRTRKVCLRWMTSKTVGMFETVLRLCALVTMPQGTSEGLPNVSRNRWGNP